MPKSVPSPISLIVTVYNRAAYLPLTLDRILAQTQPNFELLIWDDGSTDNSLQIAQSYAFTDDRIRVISAPHQGISLSLKSAIALHLLSLPRLGR
ncbi:glycosyltransferase family 2 protein [Kovacikia minuta]|uniref:glycosyltransferase family 2 protein n=1 Tax=Kovacikia minuta TaxID=2931930 RepID=UPI0028F44640|nr:glycosyltransferase family A protein [Kovacikia minuta]